MRLPAAAGFGLMAVALAMAAFTITYLARGSDPASRAQPPGDGPATGATPLPSATPDTSQPFWYMPYVNADQAKPPFVGTLNGIPIDPDHQGRTPYEVCGGSGMDLVDPDVLMETVTRAGPLAVNPARFPASVRSLDGPWAWTCPDGLAQVSWIFHVAAGTAHVNPGGSDLTVDRIRGLDPVMHSAPADRWFAAEVAGRPAVAQRPVVVAGDKQFGSCFVAVWDVRSNILTTVSAGAANAEFCLLIAEEVVS